MNSTESDVITYGTDGCTRMCYEFIKKWESNQITTVGI